MNRQQLLSSTGLTSDKLDQLLRKSKATHLIGTEEIPDELANQLIERSQASKSQQSTAQPTAQQPTTALSGSTADDDAITASALTDSQLTLTDDAFLLGNIVGDNLAQAYARGLHQGYSRGLGKFTERFHQALANAVTEVSPQELQTTFGGDSALSSAMKIRAMREQKRTLPPSSFDS